MRKYTMVDKAPGEEIEADPNAVERVTGVKIRYFDWVLKQQGKFENGDWEVRFSPYSSYPIGTEDLFAMWNRARQRQSPTA